MRVKRFVSDTLPGAVAMVRKEFGEDALIIDTRKVRRRGIFALFRRPRYEVLAAVDGSTGRRQTPPVRRATVGGLGVRQAGGTVYPSPPVQDRIARSSTGQLAQELVESASPLAGLRQHLLAQDLAPELVSDVVRQVEGAAFNSDLLYDAAWVGKTAQKVLAEHIQCVEPAELGEGRHVVPLIGPTGVGKTTTIAKLAANFALLADKKVAIVTVDTYRIAAVEQLKTYADLIGVPLEIAYRPAELAEALRRHEDKDLVFIDTAGRSQRHARQMEELKAFIDVIEEPLTHLVISATTKMSDALDVVDRFSAVPFERVIFTKLDETSSFGTIASILIQKAKKLAYLTNGQNVPDDIEVALPSRITELIMGGRL